MPRGEAGSRVADSQRAANRIFAADIPRNRFIGEKPPCAAVRVLNKNNCTALHIYTVTRLRPIPVLGIGIGPIPVVSVY